MTTKRYLSVASLIFFLVGLLHLLRLLNNTPVQFGSWLVPQWVSYFGLPIAWGLSVWGTFLVRQQRSAPTPGQ